ncbi:MAG TPA: hypothetical protein VK176_05265, partial [Phycisphaerales bacterium]|nr:hypothetical protein [Phycisphaerales bacterium]
MDLLTLAHSRAQLAAAEALLPAIHALAAILHKTPTTPRESQTVCSAASSLIRLHLALSRTSRTQKTERADSNHCPPVQVPISASSGDPAPGQAPSGPPEIDLATLTRLLEILDADP